MKDLRRDNGWTCTNNETCATCARSLFFPYQHDRLYNYTAKLTSHLGRYLFAFQAVDLARIQPVLHLQKSPRLLILPIPILITKLTTNFHNNHIHTISGPLFSTCPHVCIVHYIQHIPYHHSQ